MSNLSYQEAIEMAEPLAKAGAKVYFKFTCEACGERVSFREPNAIYQAGECDSCKHVTDPIEGYGLMVSFSTGGNRGEV